MYVLVCRITHTHTPEVESTVMPDWVVSGSGRRKAARSPGLRSGGAVQGPQ